MIHPSDSKRTKGSQAVVISIQESSVMEKSEENWEATQQLLNSTQRKKVGEQIRAEYSRVWQSIAEHGRV